MAWRRREQREVGGLKSSSMHVSMDMMCVQHHTGSPAELLSQEAQPGSSQNNQDGSMQTFGVVTIQQCTYPHSLHRRNQAATSLLCKWSCHSHYHINDRFRCVKSLLRLKTSEKSRMWTIKLHLVSCVWQQVVHCEPTQLQKMLCCVVGLVELRKKSNTRNGNKEKQVSFFFSIEKKKKKMHCVRAVSSHPISLTSYILRYRGNWNLKSSQKK